MITQDSITVPESTQEATPVVDRLVKRIQQVTSLNGNEAKTVVFYATATYALKQLRRFPILSLFGPTGTGKSTLLDILDDLAFSPIRLDGKLSKPELRDRLGNERTALIEEGDDLHEAHERLLRDRCSRQTSDTSVKREKQIGWESEPIKLFGATVLHRRQPFKDSAVLNRSIVLNTHYRQGVAPYHKGEVHEYASKLEAIGSGVAWEKIADGGGDRILDTWAALLMVAELFEDLEWIAYARGQMERARANQRLGHEEEPKQAVYQALLSLATARRKDNPEDRVLVSEVVKKLQEGGHKFNPWQVGSILRDLGFETKTSGGNRFAITGGTEKLIAVGRELGIDDEWLDQHKG